MSVRCEADSGIIERKMNLVCPHGHLMYAPRPDDWVGHACAAVLEGAPGGRSTRRCQRTLRLLHPPPERVT